MAWTQERYERRHHETWHSALGKDTGTAGSRETISNPDRDPPWGTSLQDRGRSVWFVPDREDLHRAWTQGTTRAIRAPTGLWPFKCSRRSPRPLPAQIKVQTDRKKAPKKAKQLTEEGPLGPRSKLLFTRVNSYFGAPNGNWLLVSTKPLCKQWTLFWETSYT